MIRATISQIRCNARGAPQGTAPPEAYAKPSMQLPTSADLRALPDAITKKMPETKGYRYSTIGDKVLLVEPENYTVVAVLGE